MAQNVMMHFTYRPVDGQAEALLALLGQHWPVLHRVGLTTDTPAILFRATDKRTGRPFFVEIFSWRDEQAARTAHERPEVMALWSQMGPILEGRDPELATVERIAG